MTERLPPLSNYKLVGLFPHQFLEAAAMSCSASSNKQKVAEPIEIATHFCIYQAIRNQRDYGSLGSSADSPREM